MIDEEQRRQLLSIPIERVSTRLGLDVRRHQSLCPFHDDHHPSLSFDVRRNRYRCFACGEHGNVIDLVMKVQGLGFVEACKCLADENGIVLEEASANRNVVLADAKLRWKKTAKLPADANSLPTGEEFDVAKYAPFFEHPRLSGRARQFLFSERKLRYSVVKKLKLNSWRDRRGISWLEIPFYDIDGNLIGVQERNLSYHNSASFSSSQKHPEPRFRFPKGCRPHIYNLPIINSLSAGDSLVITEGCSDCWSAISAGYKAIAIPSASSLNPADSALFEHLNALHVQCHIFPDQDDAGESLFAQLQMVLPSIVRHQLPPSCKDFSDYYLHLKSLQEKTTIS